MRKKVIIIVSIILLIIIISPIVGYLIAKESEPFQFSERKIKESTAISEILGDIKDIKLEPFGYSVNYRGTHGWAEFEVELVGTQNRGVLFLNLEKNLGVWKIVGAKLNGENITI